MIESALREVGAARSIVVDEDGVILAGNATVEAAAAAGIERVLTVDADGETLVAVRRTGLTPEQKTKLALYDNRTAELADWDPAVLESLAEDVDLSGLFFDDELTAILAGLDEAPVVDDSAYSRKVESPVYEMRGDRPAVSDLVDTERADDLLARIDAAGLPDDVRRFLTFAAYRHLRFDYAKVAEFYAHADATTQDLMERSALVIIDVDQAIEYGFARLIGELRDLREEDDDAA